MQPTFLTVLKQYLDTLQWPVIALMCFTGAWKARGIWQDYTLRADRAEARDIKTAETIELLATNHLPHLQMAMEALADRVDNNTSAVKEMNGDIKLAIATRPHHGD
jgi:hypothetical protein